MPFVRVLVTVDYGKYIGIVNDYFLRSGFRLQAYRGPGEPLQYFTLWLAPAVELNRLWLSGKLSQFAARGISSTLAIDPPPVRVRFRSRRFWLGRLAWWVNPRRGRR